MDSKNNNKPKFRILDDGARVVEKATEKATSHIDIMQRLISTLPQILIEAAVTAKLDRIKYDAYIKEKFTPEQAIELCKGKK